MITLFLRRRAAIGASTAAVGLFVAGCGSTSHAVSTGTSPSTPSAGSINVSFILGISGSPFYEAMGCGAKAEAKQLGVSVKVAAPSQFAAAQQVPIVDSAISAHPNAIVLVPTDPSGLNGAAQQVVAAGIKLVTADETLSNTSGVATQVLSDNVAGGQQVADGMASDLGAHGKVLVLTSPPGLVTSQDQRTQGFLNGLKKHPGLKYVGAQYSNDDPAKAASQVSAELARYPDLAGIFATNDQSGIGAASGLTAAHRAGQVKLLEYDASASQVQSLKNGAVQGLIAQQPRLEGMDAVKFAVTAAQGKSVPKIVETPTKLLTQSSSAADFATYTYKGSC